MMADMGGVALELLAPMLKDADGVEEEEDVADPERLGITALFNRTPSPEPEPLFVVLALVPSDVSSVVSCTNVVEDDKDEETAVL